MKLETGSKLSMAMRLVASLLVARALGAQPTPDIALDPPIECWYHSQFPTLSALVTPAEEIVQSRLYFRCSLYPDYFFVDLNVGAGVLDGVAPRAEPSCPSVHYYVEALTRDFTSARTEERVADVTSETECRRRDPIAAWFPGDDPKLVIGSTIAGTNAPPGFQLVGVDGFLTASGATVAAGSGGGGGSTALIAGVAAGGAAAGVGVLASSDSSSADTTTSSVVIAAPPPTTTTVAQAPPAPPPPPPPQAVKACFELDPPNGVVAPNEPLTIDGRCSEGGDDLSFFYDLGDGRTKEGQAFIVAVWSSPGTYILTLTVSRPAPGSPSNALRQQEEDSASREIVVEEPFEPPSPSFVVRNVRPDFCIVEFDASSSTGDIAEYRWELDVNNDFGLGVIRKSGQIVRHDWDDACFRTKGVLTVRLTVVGRDGSVESLQREVNIFAFRPLVAEASSLRSSLVSEFPDAEKARGYVVIGGASTFPVAGGSPTVLSFVGRSGTNALEAVLTSASPEPVLWRFDFAGSHHYVEGSLRVTSGQVLSQDARSAVLRLTGASGERVRLEYELTR